MTVSVTLRGVQATCWLANFTREDGPARKVPSPLTATAARLPDDLSRVGVRDTQQRQRCDGHSPKGAGRRARWHCRLLRDCQLWLHQSSMCSIILPLVCGGWMPKSVSMRTGRCYGVYKAGMRFTASRCQNNPVYGGRQDGCVKGFFLRPLLAILLHRRVRGRSRDRYHKGAGSIGRGLLELFGDTE